MRNSILILQAMLLSTGVYTERRHRDEKLLLTSDCLQVKILWKQLATGNRSPWLITATVSRTLIADATWADITFLDDKFDV